MFVCICHAVSDDVVAHSIQGGASTVAQVGRSCHAGTGCGACRVRIRQMLAQRRAGDSTTCAQTQGHGGLIEALHLAIPSRGAGSRRTGAGKDHHAANQPAHPGAALS
jgi:bacterioferritin-associated ferredoxin